MYFQTIMNKFSNSIFQYSHYTWGCKLFMFSKFWNNYFSSSRKLVS